jgi:hypothetical protein
VKIKHFVARAETHRRDRHRAGGDFGLWAAENG